MLLDHEPDVGHLVSEKRLAGFREEIIYNNFAEISQRLKDKQECIEDAVTNTTRPYYDVLNRGSGVNCQRWSSNVQSMCRMQCGAGK